MIKVTLGSSVLDNHVQIYKPVDFRMNLEWRWSNLLTFHWIIEKKNGWSIPLRTQKLAVTLKSTVYNDLMSQPSKFVDACVGTTPT